MTNITVQHGVASATPIAAPSSALAAGIRLREIDMMRGLVIVLMALDHVRDYFHSGAFTFSPLDPERTTAALYATRWITHLCAPTFVFLAGVAAFLQAAKGKQTPHLSRFLLMRGLWLVALELTVVSFGWSFAMPYPLFLQVIWAIGCSMVALAGLVWLPRVAVLVVGIAIVAGHNLLDPLTPDQFGAFAVAWKFLHEGGRLFVGDTPIGFVSYPVLPWIGVIALGYGLGAVFLEPAQKRDRTLLLLGAAMIALFILLRGFNLYGDPGPWTAREDVVRSAMAFLNVAKYPPSLMYVLATLGLGFLLIPLLARLRGARGPRAANLRRRAVLLLRGAHLSRARAGDRSQRRPRTRRERPVRLLRQHDRRARALPAPRLPARRRLCRVDCRPRAALPALPLVGRGEADAAGLVAVVLMTRLPGRRVTGPESKHHIDSAPRMAPNLVREIAPARS